MTNSNGEETYAFPYQYKSSPTELTVCMGMTLRDYFAAKAMEGMLSGLLANGMDLKWDGIAIDAYRQADAMMEARNV